MEKVCEICGKTFEIQKKRNQKYCSPECYQKAQKIVRKRYKQSRRKIPLTKICEVCGKEFRPINYLQKYCSDECREVSKMQTNNILTIKICQQCGAEFTPESNNQKYCSSCKFEMDSVRNSERHYTKKNIKPKPLFKKVCPICGVEFETDNAQRKCCSPDCSMKLKIQSSTAQAKRALKLRKNKVTEVYDEKIFVRVVSFMEEYTFKTLRQAVNFLSAYTEFSAAECINLLRTKENRIGNYKIFYD